MAETSLADDRGLGLCEIGARGVKIQALSNGCIHAIEHSGILINQVLGGPLAGGVHRIYLRVHHPEGIQFLEIVGPRAHSQFATGKDQLDWNGEGMGVRYRCLCAAHHTGDTWFFRVEIENRSAGALRCDVVMVQDIGLATRGQVRNNELFTSQYIDHFAVHDTDAGHVVMSRQNLPQTNATHPWLMQGCFPKAAGFTTDGMDFFGLGYKIDGVPEALRRTTIGGAVRQFETAYIGVQGAPADLLPGVVNSWTFFAHFVANHPEASGNADRDRIERVLEAYAQMTFTTESGIVPIAMPRSIFQNAELFRAEDLSPVEINRRWPGKRRHEEFIDGQTVSFFHGKDSRHVVLLAKEKTSVRPHGHIIRGGVGLRPDSDVMSCAFYAAGVFASQLTLGNTSLALLFSRVRDPLNIVRTGGLRIFVQAKRTDAWELLAVPSMFEMGLNDCRWIYQRGNTGITITCTASEVDPAISFSAEIQGDPMELLICGEIVGGPIEFESSPQWIVDESRRWVMVVPDPESMLNQKQSDLAFYLATPDSDAVEAIGSDELLMPHGQWREWPYVVIRTRATKSFRWTVLGGTSEAATALCRKYIEDSQPIRENTFWNEMTAGVHVSGKGGDRIQDMLAWYARDAVVHMATPRGLEQANGGAWGVRDVCQGPVEFLLSYGHHAQVADILRVVFSQQYEGRWDWPQWFMFPPFESIQSPHCHGDVLIWPLKALCDYLECSNDPGILRERLPYTDEKTFQRTANAETIIEHVDRLIARMRSEFLPGLALPKYGEGDWDDSLQPADPLLRERMVSSWTTELMYQALRRYAAAMKQFGEETRSAKASQMSNEIEADFQRCLVPDNVVAGFAVFPGDTPAPTEYLLHPSDTRTGLRYRLIPMTRGIISGMFTREQAETHLELIREHLLFPDGARLMDRPTKYSGGMEKTFKRSESAAFFGREIGLQYVHAHLRYAEALARMGKADELWRALLVVNPIAVTELVPKARARQRNCYFSSSDAAFTDRYQASKEYEKLRAGDVETDGGWRIYSSGPGIYTSLVIRYLFGIRRHFDSVEFDPVLPRELDEASCELVQDGRKVRYEFAVRGGVCGPKRISVNGKEITGATRSANPYRVGGLLLNSEEFNALLTRDENVVHIEL